MFFFTFNKEFCCLSRAKGVIDRDLKFTGYVHHYKILPWSIFGLIFEKQEGRHWCFIVSHEAVCRDFPVTPSRAKSLIGRVFQFAGYVLHYKIFPGSIYWPHCEKQDGHHGHFFNSHPGVTFILRLFLIYGKLNVFLVDTFNKYIDLL